MKTEKHLKGLEYNPTEYKHIDFVKIFFIMLIIMAVIIGLKMWLKDKPEEISIELLNADRR